MKEAPQPQTFIDGLVDNAFDFLHHAIDEVDRAPKLSVLHFYTATELFLKARLAREHWSLLFLRVDDADATRLASGDFQSIGLRDAHNRIVAITRDQFPPEALKAFEALRRHRNKLVHFIPPPNLNRAKSDARLQIVQEQCLAWHHLVELLTRHWKKHFASHSEKVDATHRLLRRHKAYLSTRYGELKPEIEQRVREGATCYACRTCRCDAFVAVGENALREGRCVVCDDRTSVLACNCSCGSELVLFGDGWGTCASCGEEISPMWLADHLDENQYDPSDPTDTRSTCTACEHLDAPTVVHFDGILVCTCCLTRWNEEDLGSCDWCGESCAGDLSNSHYDGCPHCDGWMGHIASKDD